jgi:tellurite resistance protein
MSEDFDRTPSKITHRTRVALPITLAASVVGAVVYGSWVVSRYAAGQEASERQTQEQLQRLDRKVERVEGSMAEANARLIRLEFKVDEDQQQPRRRRP